MVSSLINWLKNTLKKGDKLYIEYSVAALAVMLPLLLPGYILTLDLVFTPNIPMPESVSNSYVLSSFLHFLNYLLPSQIIEKVLLFLILLLSGVGMHRLVLHASQIKAKAPVWGAYFGGLLYMINPFTYSRFMYGHILLLLAYALIPFFLQAWWKFLQNPGRRQSFVVAGWAIAISIISIHAIFFIFLLAAVSGITKIVSKRRNRAGLVQLIKYSVISLTLVLVASSYWLVPTLRGTTETAQLITRFDNRHLTGFQTESDPTFGLVFNVGALYGFWGDGEDRYAVPKDVVPGWFWLAGIIFTLAVIGAVAGWRRGQRLAVGSVVIVGLVAWLLAMGIAFGPGATLTRFLIEHVPLYQGYREPQKFVALMALAYAFLGGLGVQAVLKKAKGKQFANLAPAGLLVIPLLYTPVMLGGFAGQLKPVQYPADWYSLNRTLNDDPADFKVLFLPWHQYMSFNFSGRVIANPAQDFFDKPIIQGDNAEFGEVYRQVETPTTLFVEERILNRSKNITDAGKELQNINVKYIIVAKELDYERYEYLDKQTDLQLAKETSTYKLYRNTAFNDGNN